MGCQERNWYMVRLAFSLFHQPRLFGKGKVYFKWDFQFKRVRVWIPDKRCNPEKWVAMQLRGDTCTSLSFTFHYIPIRIALHSDTHCTFLVAHWYCMQKVHCNAKTGAMSKVKDNTLQMQRQRSKKWNLHIHSVTQYVAKTGTQAFCKVKDSLEQGAVFCIAKTRI